MVKNVIVRVISSQIDEQGQQENMDLVSPGSLYRKDNGYYLIYNETKLTGMEGNKTSLKVEHDKVTMNRMGTAPCKMVFKEGFTGVTHYVTPYGTMVLNVLASFVDTGLTDTGGSIKLEYELFSEGIKLSENKLVITVKEEQH